MSKEYLHFASSGSPYSENWNVLIFTTSKARFYQLVLSTRSTSKIYPRDDPVPFASSQYGEG